MINDYDDAFASLYERQFGSWIRNFVPRLARFLEPLVGPGQHVLDLCCGTGEGTRALSQSGWRVTGVDRSEAMLSVAADKLAMEIEKGDVALIHADARSFALPRPADACICIDGALNHLDSMGDLEAAFASVATALRPGAPFVFDLLEASHFEAWQSIVVVDEPDMLLVRRGLWDPERNIALLKVSGGIGGLAFWRVRETLRSRTFTVEDVHRALEIAGFEVERCALTDHRDSGRSLYHARRRGEAQ